MKKEKITNLIPVFLLILIIFVGVLYYNRNSKDKNITSTVEKREKEIEEIPPEKNNNLPVMLDFGAGHCIPCKMMEPILEELKKEYKDVFKVKFVDVYENPSLAQKYGIRVIPTQIFIDGEGKEIYRHEGYMSKEEILAVWEKFSVIKENE